jgi:hypothetical protein
MKWKSNRQMESLGFAPCPTIDLIWHTHLLFPQKYYRDMGTLLGHAPAHKLLKEEQRTLAYLSDRENKEEEMWQEVWQESMFSYGDAS